MNFFLFCIFSGSISMKGMTSVTSQWTFLWYGMGTSSLIIHRTFRVSDIMRVWDGKRNNTSSHISRVLHKELMADESRNRTKKPLPSWYRGVRSRKNWFHILLFSFSSIHQVILPLPYNWHIVTQKYYLCSMAVLVNITSNQQPFFKWKAYALCREEWHNWGCFY